MPSHARHALWLSLLAVGCAGPVEAPAGPDLMQPQTLYALRPDGDARLMITAEGGFAQAPARLALPLEGVTLRVSTGARPTLHELTLPLADVDISPEVFPPSGLGLRDLALRLEGPVRAEVDHAQPEALELRFRMPLVLDWSMVLLDGATHPLGRAVTAPLDVELTLLSDPAGQLTASLGARCAGTCWSLGGVGRLSDGDVRLEMVLGAAAP